MKINIPTKPTFNVKPPEKTRTDISKGIFSPSAVETYLECPRKFYLQYASHLGSEKSSVHLIFGSAIHEAVAFFLKDGDRQKTIEVLLTAWNKHENVPVDPKKNLHVAISAMSHYMDQYESLVGIYAALEIEFSVPMPNGTTAIGVLDRYGKIGGIPVVEDTKTTSMSMSNWYWSGFSNKFQLILYQYVARQILGDVSTLVVDAIHVPAKGTDDFERRSFDITDNQITEMLNTWCKVTDEIMKNQDQFSNFMQNNTSCGNYGGCIFLPLCRYGKDVPITEGITDKWVEAVE